MTDCSFDIHYWNIYLIVDNNSHKMLTKSLRCLNFFYSDPTKTAAYNFYAKTMRRANTKANEKGVFTEHALLKLISLSTPSDSKLLYEAYYNYLGHFTLITNLTVDKLIARQIALAA